MSVEQDINTVLSAGGTLAGARVGGHPLDRSVAYPNVSYTRVGTTFLHTLAGNSGLDRVRMQVDCWAENYADAKTLSAQVRALMQAASFKALPEEERDEESGIEGVYRVTTDYYCWQGQ